MGGASVAGVPVWHEATPVGPAAPVGDPREVDDDARRPDVLVVGLGATGLTAAAALAARGAAVVGIDAAGVGGGAAGANGGFLLGGLASFHHEAVARHGRAVAARWYARTLEEIDRVMVEEPSARRTGSVRSAHDDDELADLADHHDALVADGVAVDWVEGPLGRSLLLPDDGVFDPMARCRRLARDATTAGARLVAPARAVVDGGTVLVDGERWTPGVVLVAVDGGLEGAVPSLVGHVTSARLQMLATAPVAERVLDRPTYHRYGLDYAQQLPSGVLAVGGGRDLEEGAGRGRPVAVTAVVQRHLEALVGRLLGVAVTDVTVTHRWSARSAWTDDLLPIDRWLDPRVRVVGGLSGHGNVIGPMLAREAVDELLDAAAA